MDCSAIFEYHPANSTLAIVTMLQCGKCHKAAEGETCAGICVQELSLSSIFLAANRFCAKRGLAKRESSEELSGGESAAWCKCAGNNVEGRRASDSRPALIIPLCPLVCSFS